MGVTRRKRRARKSINGNIRDEIEKELNLVELGLVNKLSNCLPCFVDFFFFTLSWKLGKHHLFVFLYIFFLSS